MVSRRQFCAAGAGIVTLSRATRGANASPGAATLASLALEAKPIASEERQARVAKLQDLMGTRKVAALLIELGASLEYFTGIRWPRSERVTLAVIPAKGETFVVTPAFEEPSIREMLQGSSDVRVWHEHENPFDLIRQGLRNRGAAGGVLAAEPTLRFFIVDGLRRASSAHGIVSAEPMVRACRMIKSPAELALMQLANNITIEALRHVHSCVQLAMDASQIAHLMDATSASLGGTPEFSLVLINEASAYPHGSLQPQTVREGSIILMDCGCSVFGYQSDISRTWVYGRPDARQRKVWNTVKRGQEIALESAIIGQPAGTIDDAVRSYYQREGWGPGYKLPGLSHRTGHGIGLDGHEAPYLVQGDATPLQAGMCFSDEPGIYLPGAFGVRLEDCWTMTTAGPKLFTPLATALDEPI